MKNLILFTLMTTLTSYSFAADKPNAANHAVIAYKSLKKAKTVPAKNKIRLAIAKDLLSMQLPESAVLYIYSAIKTQDPQTVNAAIPLLDAAIAKTGETDLYRSIPQQMREKTTSPALTAFNLTEEIKAMLAKDKRSEARELIVKHSDLPLLEAKYALATSYLSAGDSKNAAHFYEDVYQSKMDAPVDDRQRGLALLGMARTAYQAKSWLEAASYYREIPKDHPYYRRALLELSWSLFRGGQFRSALSPLQTLHSDFYGGFYQPESLYLRAMITLFTCHTDEAITALAAFDETYKNAYFQMRKWMEESTPDKKNLSELFKTADAASKKIVDKLDTKNMKLPFFVYRTAVDEPVIDVLLKKERSLNREKSRIGIAFKNFSPLQKQLSTFVQRRLERNETHVLSNFTNIVLNYAEQTEGWFTLMDLIRLETMEAKKNDVKAVMYDGPKGDVTENLSRKFFIQNGYRFWPFQGEYWRDELGNYQFTGANLCAAKGQ